MMRGRPTRAGFTLLEVMLATLILAMVVSMVTVSLSGSLKVVDATRTRGDLYYRARIAFERIGADLQSAVLQDGVEFIGDAEGDDGDRRVLLRFASMGHVEFDPDAVQGGMAEIGYALVPDPDRQGEMLLLRSDQLVRPRQDEAQEPTFQGGLLLSDHLRSMQLSYYNQAGEEMESWDTRVDPQADQEEIDARRVLPAGVFCRLEYVLDPEEETSLTFQSMFPLPAGLVRPEAGNE